MVTVCPLPSMVVLVAITISAVKVIVPLQLKVTVPPPAKAVSRCVSSQTVTMPPACAGVGPLTLPRAPAGRGGSRGVGVAYSGLLPLRTRQHHLIERYRPRPLSWPAGCALSHDLGQENAWIGQSVASNAPMSQCGPWGRAMPRWSWLLTGAAAQMASFRRVDRRAAWEKRHRLGGTAVVLQRTELGIAVDAGAGGIGIAEVPAAIGDGAGAVATRRAVGDDRVLQASRVPSLQMPPPWAALLPEKVLLLTVTVPE